MRKLIGLYLLPALACLGVAALAPARAADTQDRPDRRQAQPRARRARVQRRAASSWPSA